ncbi:hypothetical protein V1512DRAFT_200296, partial [Lipomyces arxii]|uniref:uncharacterized protein n=1 Tax=Lipomyces arxii TaxID=56418 RepID=UPI0034CD8471
IFVVTGANRGIGLSLGTQISATSKVIATVRSKEGSKSSALFKLNNVEVVELDVFSESSIDAAVKEIETLAPTGIDGIWNNAGVSNVSNVDFEMAPVNFDGLQKEITTNAIGPSYLTSKLIPPLEKRTTKKIMFISTLAGSLTAMSNMPDILDDLALPYTYSTSKIALNSLGFFLYHQLSKKGFTVLLLHPGVVLTDMAKGAFSEDGEVKKLPVEILTPNESSEKLIQTTKDVDGQASDYRFALRNYDGTIWPF